MGSRSMTTTNTATKLALETERRDVKDLWIEAMHTYRNISGEELGPAFPDVAAMIRFGNTEMDTFTSWRHKETKVDKLRSLFMKNIEFVEVATQQLAAAATPAFPPAAAIGTALTFVLSACRSVTADYDTIVAFFEDMNSFLERVSILESRLPRFRAYQVCLMEVFTSLLRMCAFATKYVKLKRFKKWVINSFMGQDEDLAGARQAMDKSLLRLQSATEYAVLANTEDSLTNQKEMLHLQRELKKNQEAQVEAAINQQKMLEEFLYSQMNLQDDLIEIKSMLVVMQEQRKSQAEASQTTNQKDGSSKSIRNIVPEILGNNVQLRLLRNTRLAKTSDWIFENPDWSAWFNNAASLNTGTFLVIRGYSGIGKSYVAEAICDRLSHTAEQDPGKFTLLCHFFCRSSIAGLDSFQSIVNTMVLQSSQQSLTIRDRINYELSKDGDKLKEEDYFEKLIVPSFGRASRHQLFVVIDAVNELRTPKDIASLVNMIDTIEKQGLRIKVIATARNDTLIKRSTIDQHKAIKCTEIQMGKQEIIADIERLITDRLRNKDSVYAGLIGLHKSVKDEIRVKLGQHSESLLYVEHMLRYFGGIGRDGAVAKELEHGMPTDLKALFAKMLRVCERRTPQDLLPAVRSLLLWMTVCFDSLDLDQANNLIQLVAGRNDLRVEDEIEDIFNRFIRIGGTTRQEDAEGAGPESKRPNNQPQTTHDFHDGDLPVAFRETSMRQFFIDSANDSPTSGLRASESEAHREVFLLCCKVIELSEERLGVLTPARWKRKLCDYAVMYCLQHWMHIDLTRHTVNENELVCKAFQNLFADRTGFARLIENRGMNFNIDKLLQAHQHLPSDVWDEAFFKRWNEWAQWISYTSIHAENPELVAHLSAEVVEYWTSGSAGAFLPLARSHIKNCFEALEPGPARTAYSSARRCLKKTLHKDLLSPEIPDEYNVFLLTIEGEESSSGRNLPPYREEVKRLRTAFNIVLDSNAYYATAVLLVAGDQGPSAAEEINQAIDTCEDTVQQSRNRIYGGTIYYLCMGDGERRTTGVDYINSALADIASMPASSIAHALFLKARMLEIGGDDKDRKDAANIYKEIRQRGLVQTIQRHNIYAREIYLLLDSDDMDGVMNLFLELTPSERFSWVASQIRDQQNPHDIIFEAARVTGRTKELLEPYLQILKGFDAAGSGILWRYYVACLHWKVHEDVEAATAELKKALNRPCSADEYDLGGADAGAVTNKHINMLTNILYEQFVRSKDLVQKRALLEEVRELPARPLPSSIQMNTTSTIPHLITVARMSRKIGLLQDFQTALQQAFEICWENLHDTFTGNDAITLRLMSKIVAQLDSMYKDAQILGSAQMYYIGRLSDLDCVKNGTGREYADNYGFKDVDGYTTYRNLFFQGEKLGIEWQESWPSCSGTLDDECCKGWSEWKPDTWDETGQLVRAEEFRKMYVCLCCTDVILCRQCYAERIKWNKDGRAKDTPRMDFCCANGEYVQYPNEEWRGIKDSMIEIEGEEPVSFQNYLDQLQGRWNRAWDSLWRG